MKNWELLIDPRIRKELERLPKKDAERLFGVMVNLPLNPYAGDIQRMEGEKDA